MGGVRQTIKRAAIGATALVAIICIGPWPAVGQTGSYKAPRIAGGAPNLNGFWQALNTANWDLEEHGAQASPYPELLGAYLAQPAGLSVVDGGTIPYRPEALVKRARFRENRLKTDPLLVDGISEDLADPEAKCFQGGVPRTTYLPLPFQIVQTKNKVLIAYEYAGAPRVVHLDKTREQLLNIDSWMGQSVGHWEGDALVVDARWFHGPTVWLDRAGNFYSKDAYIVERYTPMSPDHLSYEATITDPTVFTRPWTIKMLLYRRMDADMVLLEFQCIPLAEPFMYGTLYKKQTTK